MEMGRRDARRAGTNRFSKKSKSGSGFSAKSKKGMLKKGMLKKLCLSDEKLNSSFRDETKQEMGYEFSDLEKEVSRKKSRIPKKSLKDTNGVDHASVPRKLRSAMKKRNLESVSKLSSASSKRFNRSKTGFESCKKDLFKMENQEMEDDEKEVAETLYGLAGMFTDETNKKCDPLSDEMEETSRVESSLVVETESLEPAVSAFSLDKTKLTDEIPLEQSKSNGLKQKSVNVTDLPVRVIETKVATSETDYKSNGLALWPGLSSTVKSETNLLSKSSSTKLPPWMMGQTVSPSKNEPLRVQPRKLKKCASHIYISRLIQVLQSSKSKNEQKTSESLQLKLPDSPMTTINDFKTMIPSTKRYPNPYPKPMQEDMTRLDLNLYNPQKQSYDFLSLSSASQSHLPALNSLPQYHHISPAYNSQLSSPQTSSYQVQQISPYLANRFQTAYNVNQQQQQQLQKRLWANQYRPPTNVSTVQLSNQYSKPNLSLNLTTSSSQPLHVASSTRYNNNSNNVSQSQLQHQHQHHQHRLMAAAMSMSHHHQHNNVNRQEHHFPLTYDDTNFSATNSRETSALLYS